MISGLKPYPAYEDSGDPWLGFLPAHWVLRSLGSLTSPLSLRGRPDLPLLSVVREKGVILRSTMSTEENHNFVPDDLANYKVVRTGNLVINKMKAWQGSLGIASADGIVSPAYFVFDLQVGNRRFGQALLRSRPYVGFFARASDGVRIGQWDLSVHGMKRIPVAMPPLAEQSAIVRFLDHAERRIQRYIRAKKKLIALLNEQKQAIMHRAVTRGLDPNVSFKVTESQWFPEVPERWDVLSLRRLITRAVDGPHHSPDYMDQGIPFLSARNIKRDRWSLGDVKFISEPAYKVFCKRITPKPGDVLYTKGGTTGIARAVDLDFRFQVWVHVAVLKLQRRKISPEFLAFTLNTTRCYEQSQLFTRGATNQDLGLGRMKEIVLPVPPLWEQEAIVEFLRSEANDLIQAAAHAQREIGFLLEYRTRLIADVVTGKIDVREAAARLPEEVEEPGEESEAPAADEREDEDVDLDAAEEPEA